jgi:hypothetical protein
MNRAVLIDETENHGWQEWFGPVFRCESCGFRLMTGHMEDAPRPSFCPGCGVGHLDTALKAAALDLIRRWHSPQWKWDQHTGDLIKRLADAAGIDTSEL